jgi:hypothetical protein
MQGLDTATTGKALQEIDANTLIIDRKQSGRYMQRVMINLFLSAPRTRP